MNEPINDDMLRVCESALIEFMACHEVMMLNPANRGMKEAAIIGQLRDVITKAKQKQAER